jgi:hypothetical protein
MRKADFIVQTMLIGMGGIMAIASLFDRQAIFFLLISQFLIGIWQYGGSLIAYFFRAAKYNKKYISIASCYLLSLVIFQGLITVSPIAYMIYLIVPAWTFAIYYYKFTWQACFANSHKQSSFLPHINF